MRTVVLVHGAWHGGWCWERVVTELSARGVDARTVDLPLTTLFEDANAVRAVVAPLAEAGHDVTLVGHSYGGAVITQAGETPGVAHLVYVAAFLPDVGESVSALAHGAPAPALNDALAFSDDGTVAIKADGGVAAFYADCDPDVAAASVERLRRMQAAPLMEPVSVAAWRTVPSTYVLCTQDQAIPPELQRSMAERAARCETLTASHSPFLSVPGPLADVIVSTV